MIFIRAVHEQRCRPLCLWKIQLPMVNVLLPTDFSDNSLHAFRYAAQLLGVQDVAYTLVHAYMDADPSVSAWAGMAKELYTAAAEGMKDWERRVRATGEFAGASLRTEVVYGPLPGVLAEMAAERRADLVVMGTLGHSGAGILGSNAAAVVKHGGTPVLVVPARAATAGLQRIVMAVDQKGIEAAAMAMLLHIAKRTGCEVVLAHVVRNPDELPSPDLVAGYDGLLKGVPYRFVTGEGKDVAGVIDLLAEREGAGMIAVLHRHTGFFEGIFHASTAKQLVLNVDVPLLVLRDKA